MMKNSEQLSQAAAPGVIPMYIEMNHLPKKQPNSRKPESAYKNPY
jgi:hypothetical protein